MGDSLRDVRDRALLLVGFAGAFRRSELSDVSFTDLEWVPGGIAIVLRRSKTDQERRGRRVGIGRGQGAMCPVAALDAWLAAARIAEGPLFRAVSRHGQVSERRLSPEAVALVVKARVATAGLDPGRYSGHSLRAGLVTSAARDGVPTWRIREQTGHRSEAMLQRYIRDADMFPVEIALISPE